MSALYDHVADELGVARTDIQRIDLVWLPSGAGLARSFGDGESARPIVGVPAGFMPTDEQRRAADARATYDDDMPAGHEMLRYFAYQHLPSHLQEVSLPFAELAHHLVETAPRGLDDPELAAALRKLLEAKDCAVRAHLDTLTPDSED